jgi:hypothetical protein
MSLATDQEYGPVSEATMQEDPPEAPDLRSMMQMMMLQQKTMQQQMQQQMALIEEGNKREVDLKKALEMSKSRHGSNNAEKPKRPTIEYGAKDHEWEVFLDSWERYKEVARFEEDADLHYELRQSCSPEVNQMLLGFVGKEELKRASEKELLQHIKSVAVIVIHKEVHRQNFTKMEQGENESITQFVARLRFQARHCEFNIENPNRLPTLSFAEPMIATQMIAGLKNKEHQTSVLRDTTTLSSFQKTFDRLISLETTDKATPELGNRPFTSAGAKSQYQ